jgi:hypothetical protein
MEAKLKAYIAQATGEDLPRMVRSDMTRMTEMLAKYRAAAQDAPEEVAAQLVEALGALANARQSLLFVASVAAGYDAPPLMATGEGGYETAPSTERTPPPPEVYEVGPGGTAMLLSSVIAAAGFVSSSALAKRGIRAGQVKVGGETTTTDSSLSPGTYELHCGEIGPVSVKVR